LLCASNFLASVTTFRDIGRNITLRLFVVVEVVDGVDYVFYVADAVVVHVCVGLPAR
jgi:hypothetical protein